MDSGQNPRIAEAIAGALDWWREAGVDCAYLDDPVIWRKAEPATPREQAPADRTDERSPAQARSGTTARAVEPPPAQIIESSLPDTLAEFSQWWMEEPRLADGRWHRGSCRAAMPQPN